MVTQIDGSGRMQMVAEPFSSYDDYYAWVERTPEGAYYEVVDGLPVVTPSPGVPHQRALLRLARLLMDSCPPSHEVLTAPLDWVLREQPRLVVRQPDVVVVPTGIVGRAITEAPLLAVEILSASSVERDVVTKRREYAAAGLDHYWIVDIDDPLIAVFRRSGDELALVKQVRGNDVLEVKEPFPIRLKPNELTQ